MTTEACDYQHPRILFEVQHAGQPCPICAWAPEKFKELTSLERELGMAEKLLEDAGVDQGVLEDKLAVADDLIDELAGRLKEYVAVRDGSKPEAVK